MNKPARPFPRPLSDLVGTTLADVFKRQGFAAREVVTRWATIVGDDIATHSEPVRMQWPRQAGADDGAPGTLVLRVEGPAAIEVQHLAPLIVERVNRFFGWHAIDRIALRQAPLARRKTRRVRPPLDPEAARAVADRLAIADETLRQALGRLGAAVKRT
jgi:hypothetical protein